MELKYGARRDERITATSFNRTAYGIEISSAS